MNSPFSSAPGTCLPYSSITNFNVLESGVNHYQSNITFRWENYLEEVRQSNSLQGGLQLGLSSGLISQSDYENGYGFIYVDLSRKQSQASDDVARSIQIVGILFVNIILMEILMEISMEILCLPRGNR